MDRTAKSDWEWAIEKARDRVGMMMSATQRGDFAQALHEAHMGRCWIKVARKALVR